MKIIQRLSISTFGIEFPTNPFSSKYSLPPISFFVSPIIYTKSPANFGSIDTDLVTSSITLNEETSANSFFLCLKIVFTPPLLSSVKLFGISRFSVKKFFVKRPS